MATIICPKCGEENSNSAMNCKQCRSDLLSALEHAEKQGPIAERMSMADRTSGKDRVAGAGIGFLGTLIMLIIGFFISGIWIYWSPQHDLDPGDIVAISISIVVPLPILSVGTIFGGIWARRTSKWQSALAGILVGFVGTLLFFWGASL